MRPQRAASIVARRTKRWLWLVARLIDYTSFIVVGATHRSSSMLVSFWISRTSGCWYCLHSRANQQDEGSSVGRSQRRLCRPHFERATDS